MDKDRGQNPFYPLLKNSQELVFRFDDVSSNVNPFKVIEMTNAIESVFPDAKIIYGISLLVHSDCGERVFPKKLNALSDFRKFYNVEKMTSGEYVNVNITKASHGLVHVDHRHLSRQTQEFSILVSCSLTKSKIFIPPFNKWNEDTEDICEEHGIELVKFEDGWKSAEYNSFTANHNLWYLHPYAWTIEKFKEWLCA